MLSIFSKSKNKKTKEAIFLHIPKSGGSTFVGLLQSAFKNNNSTESLTPTHKTNRVGTTTIYHVDFSSKHRRFKGAEIFSTKNTDEFADKLLFMLLRDPIERLISEFNFQYHILEGKSGNPNAMILNNLKQRPQSFEAYIECKETQNYQLKFLLGRPINDPKKVTESELERILEKIDTLPIYCGITEEYASFLNLFEEKTQTSLPKKVAVRKKTPFIYQVVIDDTLRERIKLLNSMDYKLYDHIKKRITINNKKFRFIQSDKFIV
ncbi:MAG: sulfotransferase family protein [Algicola sp.]|nr:sulfotransferase family protein [Algicola sp.]